MLTKVDKDSTILFLSSNLLIAPLITIRLRPTATGMMDTIIPLLNIFRMSTSTGVTIKASVKVVSPSLVSQESQPASSLLVFWQHPMPELKPNTPAHQLSEALNPGSILKATTFQASSSGTAILIRTMDTKSPKPSAIDLKHQQDHNRTKNILI